MIYYNLYNLNNQLAYKHLRHALTQVLIQNPFASYPIATWDMLFYWDCNNRYKIEQAIKAIPNYKTYDGITLK